MPFQYQADSICLLLVFRAEALINIVALLYIVSVGVYTNNAGIDVGSVSVVKL